MEKYGVEEKENKTASDEKKKCPNCGKKLQASDSVNVLICKNCGTLPFEESNDSK